LSCAKLILRLAVRPHRWQEMQPLLEANLAEHEQIARHDDATVDRYATVTARVLLLGGQKSPGFVTTELFEELRQAIPDSDVEIIDGLDHQGPEEKAPDLVAERVRRHLSAVEMRPTAEAR
jgi:hypothetical protein